MSWSVLFVEEHLQKTILTDWLTSLHRGQNKIDETERGIRNQQFIYTHTQIYIVYRQQVPFFIHHSVFGGNIAWGADGWQTQQAENTLFYYSYYLWVFNVLIWEINASLTPLPALLLFLSLSGGRYCCFITGKDVLEHRSAGCFVCLFVFTLWFKHGKKSKHFVRFAFFDQTRKPLSVIRGKQGHLLRWGAGSCGIKVRLFMMFRVHFRAFIDSLIEADLLSAMWPRITKCLMGLRSWFSSVFANFLFSLFVRSGALWQGRQSRLGASTTRALESSYLECKLASGKELDIVKEVEGYKLDIELTFTRTLGSGSQLFERGWTLHFWRVHTWVRSLVTWEEPLILHVKRGQLRWLKHLFQMLPGNLPGQIFWACLTGRMPQGRPRSCLRGYVSWLAREVWMSLLRLLPLWPDFE